MARGQTHKSLMVSKPCSRDQTVPIKGVLRFSAKILPIRKVRSWFLCLTFSSTIFCKEGETQGLITINMMSTINHFRSFFHLGTQSSTLPVYDNILFSLRKKPRTRQTSPNIKKKWMGSGPPYSRVVQGENPGTRVPGSYKRNSCVVPLCILNKTSKLWVQDPTDWLFY